MTSAVLCVTSSVAVAQNVPDYAVRVSAVVQTNPARITLSWPGDVRATNYAVFRKTRDATSWGVATTLATNATTYVDSSVSSGRAYEYRVRKYCWTGTTNYTGEGYLYAGINAPLTELRGIVVLLVDNTLAAGLARELDRLHLDLTGDGWTVLRHNVARTDSVTNIKAIIRADYEADPTRMRAVFLLGHIPVPYSGEFAPDGHPDHDGAWPADVYYGEMTSTWTDAAVNNTSASSARNRNVPGDGKFDPTVLPSTAELQVGRVDFANLPAFALSEVELLRQYLNKNHWWRRKFITAQPRGLIDDHFGVFGGEAFAANGWRCFAPFFGASNTFAGDWLTTLSTQSHLWAYGCGSGSYTGAGGVATTSQLAASDTRVVFTMLFGSYFGDWDSPNNFLRAQLASPTYTLAAVWAGRPYWVAHHMGLGETIGFSTRVTQNNSTLYTFNFGPNGVHVALIGDPTLRQHPVAPPTVLTLTANGAGGVQLVWNASTDDVAGYHVYRAPTTSGTFTRLTGSLLTGTNLTVPLNSDVYLVRAVKLETNASGSYLNPSQGVFQSLDPTMAAPSIVLLQPPHNATGYELADIPMKVSTFDPAVGIKRVEFYANDVKLGESKTPPFGFTWSNAPAGDYSLSATALFGERQSTNSNTVAVHVAVVPPPTLGITDLGDGLLEIRGQGTAGLSYRFQFTEDPGHTNWRTLGAATANASGGFALTNTPTAGPQFFRSAYP